MTQLELITAAIQEIYGLTLIDIELLQDTDDLVYKLLSPLEKKYSLKIHRKKLKHSDEKISTLCDWLEFASNQVKFNLPIPIRNHQGNFLSQIQIEEIQYTFTLYEWVEGIPISTSMTSENIAKIGSVMACLHNVSEEYNGRGKGMRIYDGHWLEQASKTLISGSQRLNFSQKKRQDLILGLQNIRLSMDELGYMPSNFGIIHSDLHFSNILLNDENLSVIDFDDVGFGHYLFDIGTTFNEFADYGQRYSSMVESFIQGYQSQRTLPQNWQKLLEYFRGVAAVAYAEWVFSPENEWVTNQKMSFGISSLKQICQLN
ncbi:MAG: phosphotransferase [Xenococcaceae cyanobacterium MO_188.B29]|nr:phosphotransferase [Xenococcaceae cyanobacterium MO_188.B29]